MNMMIWPGGPTEPPQPTPGVDYEISVCDNCGEDEHTTEELKVCIDSMTAPPEPRWGPG